MKSVENEKEWLAGAFVGACDRALPRQGQDGSMPPGHNGPYHHPETPARNTAHWAISFATAAIFDQHASFRAAGARCLDWLVRATHEAAPGPVPCRHAGRDRSNGVMGQAWIIEALALAGQKLGHTRALHAAGELFDRHSYSYSRGGWYCLLEDGAAGDVDWTFNHQLWMCAVGAMVTNAEVSNSRGKVLDFARRLERRIKVDFDGLIAHANPDFLAPGAYKLLPAAMARRIVFGCRPRTMRMKSIGYHSFNTYALGILSQHLESFAVRPGGTLSKAVDFLRLERFSRQLTNNPFGYPYNPPGWETAVSLSILGGRSDAEQIDYWLAQQRKATWDASSGEFVRQTADLETSRARLYEATRLFGVPATSFNSDTTIGATATHADSKVARRRSTLP